MADKVNSVPRSKKIEKPTTPTARKSVKSLLPSLPHRHKKTNSSVSSKTVGSTGDLESLNDDTRSVTSTATAPSIGSPSSSPLVSKNEKISIVPKSPKQTTSKSKVRKTIVKGGKMLLPKFKTKNESAPVMVETGVDLHRTNRTDDELLTQNHEVGTEADSTLKPTIAEEVFSKDDWSVKGTCERVHTISQQGTRESIYVQEPDEIVEETAVDSPNGTVVTSAEPETVSDVSGSTTPTTPKILSVEEGPLNFNKKSPTTLKREIMQITNRKVSEGNQYIAAKLERKISLQSRPSTDKNDLLFKILVIGDLGTGKTSIIKRYVHQFFSQHYRATIGVDFALKVLTWDDNTTIRLQLWDIAGQERFGNMTRVYYKEAVGAFIVFDVTRTSTYDAVLKWKSDLDAKVQLPDGDGIPCVLLANKCDQPKEGAVNSHSKMDEFCRQNKFISWFETSAKDNINIDEAANSLVSAILLNEARKLQEREPSNGSAGIVSINPENSEDRTDQKFCNFC